MTQSKTVVTRLVDRKARISLPAAFANATVIIEQMSDTELRIRKARVLPEDELPFHCRESANPTLLSARDWDTFRELLDNPPEPNEALRRAAARYQQDHE
jgi:hypothetical protein